MSKSDSDFVEFEPPFANLTVGERTDLLNSIGEKARKTYQETQTTLADLVSNTRAGAPPLKQQSRKQISDLLNEMERFYFRGSCSFEDIAAHNGAATLLYILGFGVMGRERMVEKIKKGDFSGDTPENI